ncbi:protease modulator HflC [Hyphobacterium sp. HN65]|uniref:Protein HflC n=1 Tax=Hyphobacterium lacteum TaxID=3116575 RepID=A0ABU7LRL0_9PROT|nr:protease modulator HflC [Hyphobacterium sp. HN65]MEE2526276.1 protease modulator HflC [Hyphobacterium sp. HN65]
MGRILSTLVIIIGVGGAIVLSQSLFTVNERQSALILQFGNPINVINRVGEDQAGLHFKMPFITQVLYFDRRNIEFDMQPEEIQAADQERLVVDAFLRYRINNPLRFYQTVRDESGARGRLRSIMNDSLRGVIASIPSQDVISGQRSALMDRVQAAVEAQVATQDLGIEVIDVRILRADLPPTIAERVFQRMRSEREQEAAGIRAEGEQVAQEIRAEADRDAAIIRAEARAEAQRIRGAGDAQRNAIYAEAYNRDTEFFAFYRSMLAYEAAIQNGTPIVIPPDSEFFEYFGAERGNNTGN